MIAISDGKRADVSVLDELLPEPGAFYVMDRGYVDFERLHVSLRLRVLCHAHQSRVCKSIASNPAPWTASYRVA